jgi:ubiquinone/menaquinone biosynthesis C-methylase UbiE
VTYASIARYYDRIYSFKNYRLETRKLLAFIRRFRRSRGNLLLDVACGTGAHLVHLRRHFTVEGVDASAGMLRIARRKLPGVRFTRADMTRFDLGRAFDVVTCLFSSIGYVRTLPRLHKAIRCMAAHLKPGGLLLIEPWFTRETWKPPQVHALLVNEPGLKLCRVNTSLKPRGRITALDMHYLIGTHRGTRHLVEHHECGLFSKKETLDAFRRAGLWVRYDRRGISGRGLYVGMKPVS